LRYDLSTNDLDDLRNPTKSSGMIDLGQLKTILQDDDPLSDRWFPLPAHLDMYVPPLSSKKATEAQSPNYRASVFGTFDAPRRGKHCRHFETPNPFFSCRGTGACSGGKECGAFDYVGLLP
jgi:hypothetical protein